MIRQYLTIFFRDKEKKVPLYFYVSMFDCAGSSLLQGLLSSCGQQERLSSRGALAWMAAALPPGPQGTGSGSVVAV